MAGVQTHPGYLNGKEGCVLWRKGVNLDGWGTDPPRLSQWEGIVSSRKGVNLGWMGREDV